MKEGAGGGGSIQYNSIQFDSTKATPSVSEFHLRSQAITRDTRVTCVWSWLCFSRPLLKPNTVSEMSEGVLLEQRTRGLAERHQEQSLAQFPADRVGNKTMKQSFEDRETQ